MGMPGANDPDNRRMMRFEDLDPEEELTKEITKQLIQLRRNNLCLTYGDFKILHVDANTLIYMRSYFEKASIIIFNKGGSSETLAIELPTRFKNSSFKSNFNSKLDVVDTDMEIIIEGNSFDIITN